MLDFATFFGGGFEAGVLAENEVGEVDLIPARLLEDALIIVENLYLELTEQAVGV